MLWAPLRITRPSSNLTRAQQRIPTFMATSGCWSAVSHPQLGSNTSQTTKVKLPSAAAAFTATLHGLEAGRKELRVLCKASQLKQPVLQTAHTAVCEQISRLHKQSNLQHTRKWSLQALSWLWRPSRSSASSSEGRDGLPTAATAVDTTIGRAPPAPAASSPVRPAGKLEPLPDESGPDMQLETAAAMIPNPTKSNKLGEDAYFVTADGTSFGVADGVGGWILSGIDSGQYSRLLMQMSELFSESKTLNAHPKQILWAAYKQTQVAGSCTACILKVKRDQLHASNVGDSGFMVVRGSDVVFQSPHQQHSFNFPYQLGRVKPNYAAETPERAEVFKVQLQEGDILVAGTDGLFDNVFPEESAALVRHARMRGQPAAAAAKLLAQYTFRKAADVCHMSPFAYAAQAHGQRFVGGKLDDITVVVSYVSAPAAEPDDDSNSSNSSGSGTDEAGPEKPPTLSKL